MHYNETEAIVSVSDCQYIEAFVYPDDDGYCFTMERDRDFKHLLQKIYPIPHKKLTLPVDARSVCNSWDSTITHHKPGISSVVAGSVDRRTVDLVSSTSPGNNPAAHCSRDSVSPRRSREGICKYGPKTMHEILTFTNFGVQNPKSGNQSRSMLVR